MTQQRQDPDPRAWGETKHQIGDSNIRPFELDIHNPVFMLSSVVIAAFVLIAVEMSGLPQSQVSQIEKSLKKQGRITGGRGEPYQYLGDAI